MPPEPATSGGWPGSGSAAAAVGHRDRRDGQHGRAAAVPGLRRQGGRFRNPRTQRVAGRRGALRAGRHRARLGVHHHLQPAFPVGRVRAKGRPSPSKLVAEMHRPPPVSWSPRPSWPQPAWCSGCGRPGWTTCWTATPTPFPAVRTTSSRCGTGWACLCCCRCSSSPSAPRCSSAGPDCAASGWATCRWATPTASTTPSSTAPTCCRGG